MALYLGKKKVAPIKVVDLDDDLDKELTENERLADEIQATVNELKDISNETINITKNGEYNVKDYGKVVISVGGIEIDLPDPLNTCKYIYYKQFEDIILLSGGDVKNDIGIFKYYIKTKNIEHIYTEGYGWSQFYQVNNIVFIGTNQSGGRTAGILTYDINTGEVLKVWNSGFWYIDNGELVTVLNKAVICSGYGNGVVVYDFDTKTVKSILGGSVVNLYATPNNKVLATQGISGGVYVYDIENDKSLGKIIDRSGITLNSATIKDRILMTSFRDSKEIYVYNYLDDTAEVVYTEGTYETSQPLTVLENKVLVVQQSGTGTNPLLVYDYDTNIMSVLSEIKHLSKRIKLDDHTVLMASANSSTYGLYLYDELTNTIEQVYTTGYNYMLHRLGDKILMLSPSTSGIRFYNITDKTVEVVTTDLNYNDFELEGNICKIKSKDHGKTVYYNLETNEIDKVTYLLEVQ